MQESKYLIKEMKIDYTLKNNTMELGKVLLKYNDLWKSVFIFVIFLLNAVMLASYSSDHGSRLEDPKLFGLSVTATKVIMIALGLWCVILWLLICAPVLINIAWMQKYKYDVEMQRRQDEQLEGKRGVIVDDSTSVYKTLKTSTMVTYMTLSNPMFIYMFMLGASILLGLLYHPFFYSFLVVYIIVQSPQMNSLLSAIWEPKTAILATIFLMFLIVYLLVIWSYMSFPTDYPDNN